MAGLEQAASHVEDRRAPTPGAVRSLSEFLGVTRDVALRALEEGAAGAMIEARGGGRVAALSPMMQRRRRELLARKR